MKNGNFLRRQRSSNGRADLPPNRAPPTRPPTSKSTEEDPRRQQSSGSQASGAPPNGVNVKVILRCRPMASFEKRPGGPTESIIECREESREVVVRQSKRSEVFDKTFSFDGVCGPETTQARLFQQFIVPLVDEVLLGFNCTIFAYGQTGTGKTFTMEGDWTRDLTSEPPTPINSDGTASRTGNNELVFRLPPGVGVIPRSIALIFERLANSGMEFSIRVSYLEIYNEELNDLLQEGERPTLRIFDRDQAERLGVATRGLAVDKLEEVAVHSLPEVYRILSLAVRKRRTAETLLNRQSSRSHSIFTVTITMKEINLDGEDIIRIGKLNLVDLAGSENIQRSGTSHIKDRTKEAGMINQSLLTLGRVINSLVEHSTYVPYRDSKLTRLLQDSLGGRTKTCIIATISPSALSYDETLSTLDYAHRAKHIRNRPEVNQRMTQKFVMKELTAEIERLKQELTWAREKSGAVYLSAERYEEIQNQTEQQNRLAQEQRDAIRLLQDETRDLRETNDNLVKQMSEVLDEKAMAIEALRKCESRKAEYESLLDEAMKVSCETSFVAGAKTVECHDLATMASRQREALGVYMEGLSTIMDFTFKSQREHRKVIEPAVHWMSQCRELLSEQWRDQLDSVSSKAKTIASEFELGLIDFSSQVQLHCDQIDSCVNATMNAEVIASIRQELSLKFKEHMAEIGKAFNTFTEGEDEKWKIFVKEIVDKLLRHAMSSVKEQLRSIGEKWRDDCIKHSSLLTEQTNKMLDDFTEAWGHLEETQLSFESWIRKAVEEILASHVQSSEAISIREQQLKQRESALVDSVNSMTCQFKDQMSRVLNEFSADQSVAWNESLSERENAGSETKKQFDNFLTEAESHEKLMSEQRSTVAKIAQEGVSIVQSNASCLVTEASENYKLLEAQKSKISELQRTICHAAEQCQRDESDAVTLLYKACHEERMKLDDQIQKVLTNGSIDAKNSAADLKRLVTSLADEVNQRTDAAIKDNEVKQILCLIEEYATLHGAEADELGTILTDISRQLDHVRMRFDAENIEANVANARRDLIETVKPPLEPIPPMDVELLRSTLSSLKVVPGFLRCSKQDSTDELMANLDAELQANQVLCQRDRCIISRLFSIIKEAHPGHPTLLESGRSSVVIKSDRSDARPPSSERPAASDKGSERPTPRIGKLRLPVPQVSPLASPKPGHNLDKIKAAAKLVLDDVVAARSSEMSLSRWLITPRSRPHGKQMLVARHAVDELREISTMSEGITSEFVSTTENDQPRNSTAK